MPPWQQYRAPLGAIKSAAAFWNILEKDYFRIKDYYLLKLLRLLFSKRKDIFSDVQDFTFGHSWE